MVSITKWLIVGLVGAFAISALVDPARASGTASAFGGVGTALGNLGRGVQGLLTGTGTGVSKLFNPLFTLRDLIYGPQGGVQVGKDVAEVVSTTPAVTVQDVINTQTVASQNSGNATGVSSASSNFQAGAAQAAGYSLGGMALTNPGRGWTGKPSPAPTNINRGSSGRRSAARTRGGKTAGQSRTKR
jgi:hypothetical protein